MKKFYLIAALAIVCLAANAQQKLYLSTYTGTNVEKYDGQSCHVSANRYMFHGWNTIALPFSMTVEELNQTFGDNCKLERLIGIENDGNDIVLNFQDCKTDGLQANTPYVLYYAGENANTKIEKDAIISSEKASVSFSTTRGDVVTMSGVQAQTKGIGFYGIPARDNSEVNFKKIDESLNGFFATRCYIQLTSATASKLKVRHLAAGEVTSIQNVLSNGEVIDVYNLAGKKVAAGLNAQEVNQLKQGIYIVKGQKIMVK